MIVSPKNREVIKGALDKMATPQVKSIFRNLILGILVWFFCILNMVKQLLMPIYRFVFAARHPVIVRTPEERFVSAQIDQLDYNFEPHYLEVYKGRGLPRMHYIDEYQGLGDKASAQEIILCLHGEPTWSFLYRKMVPGLVSAGYRVIVPDFVGFGKSDKYVDLENYNHEFHMMCIRQLLEELNVMGRITLVCQDWGGLVGLSLVKDSPDIFSNLVIMNTGLPIGGEHESLFAQPSRALSKILPFLLWRSVVSFFGTSLSLEFLFKHVVRFPPNVVKAYTAPFPNQMYKGGVAKWPLLVPLFSDDPVAQHMVEARNCLKIWTKPALVMFGTKDPITRGQDKLFCELMPHAKVVPVEGASHFLQETHGVQLAENIVNFIENKNN